MTFASLLGPESNWELPGYPRPMSRDVGLGGFGQDLAQATLDLLDQFIDLRSFEIFEHGHLMLFESLEEVELKHIAFFAWPVSSGAPQILDEITFDGGSVGRHRV